MDIDNTHPTRPAAGDRITELRSMLNAVTMAMYASKPIRVHVRLFSKSVSPDLVEATYLNTRGLANCSGLHEKLAQHFAEIHAADETGTPVLLSDTFIEEFKDFEWDGNLRSGFEFIWDRITEEPEESADLRDMKKHLRHKLRPLHMRTKICQDCGTSEKNLEFCSGFTVVRLFLARFLAGGLL